MSTGKSSQPPGDNKDEPAFRYSLELVATIAAQFAGNGVNDREATERAIQLLNAVGKTIEGKMIMIRARKEAERLSLETPKHLPFAAGIRYITGKPTETEATTAFRDYLRLNLRLSDIGRPSRLTDEEVKAVLKPLPEGKEKEVEDARIEKIIARERSRGFGNNHLITYKRDRDFLQASFVRRHRNSEKGKLPPAEGKTRGRPKGSTKKQKKSLERKSTGKK